MAFAFDVIDTVLAEEPDLFDDQLHDHVRRMLREAVDTETRFAQDLLSVDVPRLSPADMRTYLEHIADRRLAQLGMEPEYGAPDPFGFLEPRDG